ncbi:conserved hypothetical protein [Ricinus communis]|uniref:Uncharacterized protein n=1 Tax=Ricinus communis TaxID=3988 RepID=B9S189_RICCO|nr:conserved hypothetical protein [Ricinus communis]
MQENHEINKKSLLGLRSAVHSGKRGESEVMIRKWSKHWMEERKAKRRENESGGSYCGGGGHEDEEEDGDDGGVGHF